MLRDMIDVIFEDVVEQVEAWTVELAGWMERMAGVAAQPEPRGDLRGVGGWVVVGVAGEEWVDASRVRRSCPSGRVRTGCRPS